MSVATQDTAVRTGRVARTLIYLLLVLFALFYIKLWRGRFWWTAPVIHFCWNISVYISQPYITEAING